MAYPIDDLHIVLTTCDVSVDATRTLIINNEYPTFIAAIIGYTTRHTQPHYGNVIIATIQKSKVRD